MPLGGDLSSGPRVQGQGCALFPPYRELNSFQKTVSMCGGDYHLWGEHGATGEHMRSVALFVALNTIPDKSRKEWPRYSGSHFEGTVYDGMEGMVAGTWGSWLCGIHSQEAEMSDGIQLLFTVLSSVGPQARGACVCPYLGYVFPLQCGNFHRGSPKVCLLGESRLTVRLTPNIVPLCIWNRHKSCALLDPMNHKVRQVQLGWNVTFVTYPEWDLSKLPE